MSLLIDIAAQLKQAMRDRDADRVGVLRLIKTELVKEEMAGKSDLSPERELAVLKKMAKQRRESIELYEKGDRPKLAAQEATELKIVESFLPASLSTEQIDEIIAKTVGEPGEVDPQKAGMVIGQVMAALKATGGSFDGKDVSRRVRERLGA